MHFIVKYDYDAKVFFNEHYLLKNLKLILSIICYKEAPSLEELLSSMSTILLDRNSLITIKHGLAGLRLCFRDLLESNDYINLSSLNLIDCLIELKESPYWLVKVWTDMIISP